MDEFHVVYEDVWICTFYEDVWIFTIFLRLFLKHWELYLENEDIEMFIQHTITSIPKEVLIVSPIED